MYYNVMRVLRGPARLTVPGDEAAGGAPGAAGRAQGRVPGVPGGDLVVSPDSCPISRSENSRGENRAEPRDGERRGSFLST